MSAAAESVSVSLSTPTPPIDASHTSTGTRTGTRTGERSKLLPAFRQKETSQQTNSSQVTFAPTHPGQHQHPNHGNPHHHHHSSTESFHFLKPPTFPQRKDSTQPSASSGLSLNTPATQLQPNQKQHFLAKLRPLRQKTQNLVTMAKGTLALKALSLFLRLIQFGCAAVILAIFSYFLAVLANNDLSISTYIRAVEGIAGAGVVYTILGLLLVCCLGGVVVFSLIAVVFDFAFAGAFAYVAYATRGGRSCSGIVDTPLGVGDVDSENRVGNGRGGMTGLPGFGTACRLNSACFAVAIIGAVFFLLSIPLELSLIRHHKKEKAFGPSPHNNYTAGRSTSRKFWQRKPKYAADVEKPDALPMHTTPADARMSYATESTAVTTDRYGNVMAGAPGSNVSGGTGWQTTTTTSQPGYGGRAANF